MVHPRRHPLIWLALAAMLALALLPTVSHALAHARGGTAFWADVCTPRGLSRVVWAPFTAGRDAAPLPSADRLERCPLCTLAADHPGLPSAPAQAGLQLPLDARPLPRIGPAPRPPPAWSSAQPRGPPVSA